MVTGNDSVDLTEQDLEEDFDPEKHDAVMEVSCKFHLFHFIYLFMYVCVLRMDRYQFE